MWIWKIQLIYMVQRVVLQKSDFTGEIEHACTCIESGLIESPIMSRNASLEILKVIGV